MSLWLWLGFILFILTMLGLDLGVFNRKAHVVSTGEALVWTAFWVMLALAFNCGVYWIYEQDIAGASAMSGSDMSGQQAALQFFTGYVIEKSLSLDNIFVIALIFAFFQVPAAYQHRVLFWGVLGALVLRGAMIAAGAALIHRFGWVTYIFGGLLIVTAVKMLILRHDNIEPERNPLVRLARRFYPVSGRFEEHRFFTRLDGRRAITPLFLVLLVVESSDALFAVDSIPAIFAITHDPFLVFTSNIFAILGLRSLYFALAGVMDKFRYLKTSLVFVLAFVGVKMLLAHHHAIPTLVSLTVIGGILSVGVLASIFAPRRDTAPLAPPPLSADAEPARSVWRRLRRLFVLLIGGSVLAIGFAMILLPGPAVLVIPAGLAILASECLWARRILAKRKRLLAAWRGNPSEPPQPDADVEFEQLRQGLAQKQSQPKARQEEARSPEGEAKDPPAS
ncbi:MAG: TerC/Alx family metal homeostasis membrane protein [Phycisphaerae bacterium]|nr:TerC/Alx family metal homeostasis membrane protein [Phycisphaerae bacterium]